MSAVRKIGTIVIRGRILDLAMNDHASLGEELKDLYDRPFTRPVSLKEIAGEGSWDVVAQQLLDALAAAMKERDAALASLQKGSD